MLGSFTVFYLSLSHLLLGKAQHSLEEAVARSPVTFYRTEGAEHSEFATFPSVCRLPEELFSESPNLEFRCLKAVEIPT